MLENELTNKDVVTSPKFRYHLDSMAQLIAEISNQLALQFDLDDLVETTTKLTVQRLGYDECSLYLLDTSKQKICLKIEATANQEEVTQSYASEHFANPAYRAVRHRSLVIIADGQTRPSGIRSEIYIPLEYHDDLLGVLSLGSVERHVFDEADTVLALKILAAQVAVSINRAYQYEKKFEATPDSNSDSNIYSYVVQMQNILPEIQSLGGGIRALFDKVVRGVVEGLGYTAAMLAVVDETNMTLPVQAIAYSNFIHHKNWDIIEKMLGVQIIGNYVSLANDQDNLGVQTYYSGTAKVTRNLYDLFRPVTSKELSARIQHNVRVKTCVSIPLTAENKVVGTLYAGTEREEISSADLDALHFFVTNAAIAIHNSLLFDKVSHDLAQRDAQLKQLRRIERVITSSLNLEEVLKHILNGAIALTNADSGQVMLVGKFASGLVHRVTYPDALDVSSVEPPGLISLVNEYSLPDLMIVTDVIAESNQKTLKSSADNQNGQTQSLLSVPIALDDELVGVISIARHKANAINADAFNETSLDLLDQLAVQAAIAIRNAYQFKIEQEIRERLSNISQVVAMGDMAGNMVHSINNWVGAVRADIKYLLRQYSFDSMDKSELMDLLQDMLSNAESTLAMAENIKKPFQPLEQEPIDLNECISQVLHEKHHELQNVIVIEDLHPLPRVLATRQLELVFENLVNNALYAMKDQMRGILRCATRLSKDGQWIEVIVQDTGPGLSENLNPNDIFKLGVSDKANGMGYGLWWSDTFLKRWGGQIKYVPKSKRGCKFVVKLPVISNGPK